MNLTKQQMMVIAGVAALIVVIGGYAWYQSAKVSVNLSPAGAGSVTEPGATAGDSTVPAPGTTTPGTTTKPGATGTGSVTQTYADALKIYGASGYRYQFVNCSGDPGRMVVKKGQKFMMDNRDNKAHKFVVQGHAFTIGSYGFAVVTAGTVGTSKITCDGGGAADLVVSK